MISFPSKNIENNRRIIETLLYSIDLEQSLAGLLVFYVVILSLFSILLDNRVVEINPSIILPDTI